MLSVVEKERDAYRQGDTERASLLARVDDLECDLTNRDEQIARLEEQIADAISIIEDSDYDGDIALILSHVLLKLNGS